MGAMKTRSLSSVGKWVNEVVSFVVFCLLDIVDSLLCVLYKTADYLLEAEWKPCYCLSPKELITTTTTKENILVSHTNGESKILTVSPLQQKLRYIIYLFCFLGIKLFAKEKEKNMSFHRLEVRTNVACLSNNNVRVQDSH